MKKNIIFIIMVFIFIGVVNAEETNCISGVDQDGEPVYANCQSYEGLVTTNTNYLLGKGESVNLNVSLINVEGDKQVIYETTDSNCFTIDTDGKVTASTDDFSSCSSFVTATYEGNTGDTITIKITVVNMSKVYANGGTITCSPVSQSRSDYGSLYSIEEGVLTLRGDYVISKLFIEDDVPTEELGEDKFVCNIKKNGKYFSGWYTGETDGELVDIDDRVEEKENIYARWSDNKVALESISIGHYPHIIAIPLKQTGKDEDFEEQLVVNYEPYYATNKKVRWTSSDESILTVSDTGVIKGVKEGVAVVDAVSEEGEYIAKMQVYVGPSVMNVLEPAGPVIMEVGDSIDLHYYQVGIEKVSTFPTFKSSDETIARIDSSNGTTKLVAIKAGKVTITANLGNMKDELEVMIFDSDSGLKQLYDCDDNNNCVPIKSIIKFDANGSTGSMLDLDISLVDLLNDGIKLPKSSLQKEGSILSGWKVYKVGSDGTKTPVEVDGEELVVPDEGVLKGFIIDPDESLYLEAIWVENPDTGLFISIASMIILVGIFIYTVIKNKRDKIVKTI